MTNFTNSKSLGKHPTLVFLSQLHAHCTEDDGQVVVVRNKKQLVGFYDLSDAAAISKVVDESPDNLYLKVGLFDAAAIQQRNQFGIGSKDELKTVAALHLDIDVAKNKYASQEQVFSAIREIQPQPSVIVYSDGQTGGFHCYWVLGEPYRISNRSDIEDIHNRIRGLRMQFPEELGLDNAPSPSGLLRLPGSIRDSGNMVTVKEVTSECYSLKDFPKFVEEPKQTKTYAGAAISGSSDRDSVIARYLDAHNETVVTVLQKHGWRLISETELVHPNAESGSRSGVLYHQKKDGTLGVTIHTANCPPLHQHKWYSRDHAHVLLNFGGDWKAAASDAHRFFESQLTPVDLSRIIKDVVPLDEYREELEAALLEVPNLNAVCLCRAPAGAGKTHAATKLIANTKMSQFATPTHVNVSDTTVALKRTGVDAIPYPRIDDSTCIHAEEADDVRQRGLEISKTICMVCEVGKENCVYWKRYVAASLADHSVCTQARWGHTETPETELLVLDENPIDAIVVQDKLERAVLPVLEKEIREWEQNSFTEALLSVLETLRQNKSGRMLGYQPPKYDKDDKTGWQERVWQRKFPFTNQLRILVDVTANEYGMLITQEDSILCQRKNFVPQENAVILDATANPKLIQKAIEYSPCNGCDLTGIYRLGVRDIVDVTPNKSPEIQNRPIQLPLDITRGQRGNEAHQAKTRRDVGRMVTSIAMHGDHHRIGVLTHGNLRDFEADMPKELRRRVVRVSYFGAGESRGSNVWLNDGLDALMVIGTPRVAPKAIQEGLLQFGYSNHLPQFVTRDAKYANGQVLKRVLQYPHEHPANYVYQQRTEAALVQAVGRVRPLTESGVKCYLVSNEPVPAWDPNVVHEHPALGVSVNAYRFWLDWVSRHFSLDIYPKGKWREKPIQAAELAIASAIPKRTVVRYLKQLRNAGFVYQPDGNRKAGWMLKGIDAG